MFVRNQDGIDAVRLLANGCQPLGEFAETEARIH
jgi:hypothetical protein